MVFLLTFLSDPIVIDLIGFKKQIFQIPSCITLCSSNKIDCNYVIVDHRTLTIRSTDPLKFNLKDGLRFDRFDWLDCFAKYWLKPLRTLSLWRAIVMISWWQAHNGRRRYGCCRLLFNHPKVLRACCARLLRQGITNKTTKWKFYLRLWFVERTYI